MSSKGSKIALLFGYFSKESYDEILCKSKGGMQNAANALQVALLEGIGTLHNDVEIFNFPYIGSFPQRYKSVFSPCADIVYETGSGRKIEGRDVRFCNICGYKFFSRYQHVKKELLKWCRNNKDEKKVIMIYALCSDTLRACYEIKNKFNDSVKIVQIIPDLPEYMSETKSVIKKKLKSMNIAFINKHLSVIDGYVLLSKYMADYMNIYDKPWTVVEGIFHKEPSHRPTTRETQKRQIFYAGTLAKRYGIMTLLNAFMKIKDDSLELVICGAGEAEVEIVKAAQSDSRIIFKGQLPREEVLQLQLQATLLVNPRTPEGEFTKYSFPSKTMEYLASGIPTLMYRLPGIPDEYFEHAYVIDELGDEALSAKMKEILAKPQSELDEFGRKAKVFISEEKNPVQQCKKILQLLDQLN